MRKKIITLFILLMTLCFGFGFVACKDSQDSQEDLTYKKYLLRFSMGDTYNLEEIYVYHGKTATPPESPTKEGYAFCGWEYQGEKFDFSMPIVKDMYFSPIWEEKVVEIYTSNDLMELQNDGKADYILKNDIDFGGKLWTGSATFSGNFDGSGYTIKNIKILNGFFSRIEGEWNDEVTIKNLSIEYQVETTDDEADTVGGLVQWQDKYSQILNCSAKGSIIVKGENKTNKSGELIVGGLVGRSIDATMYNSFSAVTIDVKTDQCRRLMVGGLIGENESAIKNCYAIGNLIARATRGMGYNVETWAGGLIGKDNASVSTHYVIESCYADVDVVAQGYKECYAGGLIGYGGWAAASKEITYRNCFAIGDVSAEGVYNTTTVPRPIFGKLGSSGQVENCHFSSAAVILDEGVLSNETGGKEESVLLSKNFLVGTLKFDEYIWKFGKGKPYLYWQV